MKTTQVVLIALMFYLGINITYAESDPQEEFDDRVEEEDSVDPSTVPYRSLRRRRNTPSNNFRPSRRGFNDSVNNRRGAVTPPDNIPAPRVVRENEEPKSSSEEVEQDANDSSLKTVEEQKIVLAGPEYNKDKQKDVPKDLKPTLVENFDFHEAEMDDVVKAISKLTKKNFILSQKLRGKVTIISPSPISIEDAWRAFLTSLQINGLTIVETGAYLKVVEDRVAKFNNIRTFSGTFSPDSDEIITRFINLKYIDAEEMVTTLNKLVDRKQGDIIAYARTNTLIITDSGSNILRLLKLIKELDVAGFEEKLEIIKVQYASASEIADKINEIIDKDESRSGSSRQRRVSRRRSYRDSSQDSGSPAEFKGKIIADDKTNSLIVLATESNLKKLKRLLRQIDYATKTSASSNIHIHYLRNATAEEVANTLTGITGNSKKSNISSSRSSRIGRGSSVVASIGGDALFSSDIKINADKPTNSLVIIASQQDYESLKIIIDKLDLRRKQVYVEAIIAEINITKNKQLGVSASKVDPQKGIYSFGSGDLNSMQVLTDPLSLFATGLVGAVTNKNTRTITTKDGDIQVPDFSLVIKAMFGNSDVNVLSTPQILTTDNEDAEIFVGEQVPFVKGTTLGTTASQQSIDREKIGIKLKITPQINESNEYVKLKLEQEADDFSIKTIQGMPSNVGPATTERSTKTTVIVRDQEMVSIGGLIRDKISESTSKIPILGDLPLVGWLFRNKSTNVEKVNLIMFIKPTIISDYSDLRKVYHNNAEERRKFVTKIYGEEDIHQKFIDDRDKMKIQNMSEGDQTIEDIDNKEKGTVVPIG